LTHARRQSGSARANSVRKEAFVFFSFFFSISHSLLLIPIGIFIHWSLFSVPSYCKHGDIWYAKGESRQSGGKRAWLMRSHTPQHTHSPNTHYTKHTILHTHYTTTQCL
jgi:hypothetical protein